jgi:hypothetical protein
MIGKGAGIQLLVALHLSWPNKKQYNSTAAFLAQGK